MCVIEGCEKPVRSRGLCSAHYTEARRNGLPLNDCAKPNCPELAPLGYKTCINHRNQCLIDNCAEAHAQGRLLCYMHYHRLRKNGSPGTSGRRKRLNGTGTDWIENSDGYLFRVWTENGKRQRITQHKEVMERTLGRKLLAHEEVHHINGDRKDNRPQNLELWSMSQPRGQRVVDKVAWAKEILSTYPDL